MGDKTNNIIEKIITYDIPDDYLGLTSDEGKTSSWTYEGPDKIWLFAYEDTNIVEVTPWYTEAEDGEDIPTPIGMYKICVDTNKTNHQPLASIAVQHLDHSSLPRLEETLPDGSIWSRLDPLPPHEVYDDDNITYDKETGNFTYPWKPPHVTWDDIKRARTALLKGSDAILQTTAMTDEERAAYETYRQTLRDIPSTFEGIDPWKVPFPNEPVIASQLIDALPEGSELEVNEGEGA
jgi:hypothetical protein